MVSGSKNTKLLLELLDMVPLPFKWLDNNRAVFTFEGRNFGIYVDFLSLVLKKKHASVVNVSFGIIKDKFVGADDLDTTLTNLGKIRTVLSTVAAACIANKEVALSDIVCIASADQAKDQRNIIYSIALSEIRAKVPAFSHAKQILVMSNNGTKIILLSKVEFTEADKLEISNILGINKL